MPRSRNYPIFGLQTALAKIKQLWDRDGKATVDRAAAVQAWGYSGLNGASLRVLGALNQFGLLDSPSPKAVKISALALTILLEPEGSAERAAAILQAAKAPAIFSELQSQYPDGFPSDGAMISNLVRNQGFNEGAAKDLIASLRDTWDLVGKLKTDDIPSGEQKGEQQTPPAGEKGQSERTGGDRMEFTWPLSGDATAKLTVTKTLEPDDIETLTAYFEIAKKALTKAASKGGGEQA